jgi:hypothetical protein
MKKMAILMAIIAMSICGNTSFAAAESLTTIMTIEGAGITQRYVPFTFVIPSGNCQNLRVWQYQVAYHFFGIEASWRLQPIGKTCAPGWYRFSIQDLGCSNVIQITGQIEEEVAYRSWGYREVEPGEIGIFVKGIWKEKNVFGLDENDSACSYLLVYPGFNRTNTLKSIVNGDSTFFHYDVQGIILGRSVDGGFLASAVVQGKDYARALKTLTIGPDDILILIVREHY